MKAPLAARTAPAVDQVSGVEPGGSKHDYERCPVPVGDCWREGTTAKNATSNSIGAASTSVSCFHVLIAGTRWFPFSSYPR
jgi:hypothetical protein